MSSRSCQECKGHQEPPKAPPAHLHNSTHVHAPIDSCSEPDWSPGHMRFLHNVAGAPAVNIFVDKDLVARNLNFQDLTGYLTFSPGVHLLFVKTVSDNVVIARGKFQVKESRFYTAIVEGLISDLATIKARIYADRVKCAEPGIAKARFIHAAAGVPAVDVYAQWAWSTTSVKIFSDVAYGQTGKPTYAPIKLEPPPPATRPEPTALILSANLAGTTTVVTSLTTYPSSGSVYTLFASGSAQIPGGSISILASQDNQGECDQLQVKFDTQAYMGKWNQIASIPQFYETQCANATAEYTLLATQVKVLNTCLDQSGTVVGSLTGSATALPCQPAALTVTFPGFPVLEPGPNYLVHWTDYIGLAVIGSPNRTTLYFLARGTQISQRTYDKLRRYATGLGYDVSRLRLNYNVIASKKF